jgi:membrane protease YdiL (CAAX protease family)
MISRNEPGGAKPVRQKRAQLGRARTANGGTARLNSRALAGFFLLAYAISWAAWAIPVLPSLGPMLAAIIVTAVTTGRAGLRGLLSGLTRWRVRLRWWLVAISPVVLVLLTLAALIITGQRLPDSADVLRQFAGSSGAAAFLFVLATAAASVGEEVGWRGYALPQLQRRFRPLPATLVLGLLWWLWHLEFFIVDELPVSQFLVYLIEVVAVAIILTWLYNRSGGSILLVVIFHAAYNGVSITGLTTTVVALAAILQGMLLVVLELYAGSHGRSVLGSVTNGQRRSHSGEGLKR